MLFGGVRSREASDAGGVSFISDNYLRVPMLSEFKRQLGIVLLNAFRKLGGGFDRDTLGDFDVRVFVTPDSSTDSFAETTWRVITFVITSALPVPVPGVTISLGADNKSKHYRADCFELIFHIKYTCKLILDNCLKDPESKLAIKIKTFMKTFASALLACAATAGEVVLTSWGTDPVTHNFTELNDPVMGG